MSSPAAHGPSPDPIADKAATAEASANRPELDDLWPAIVARIGELREYGSYYIAANVDRLRLAGRRTMVWTVLALMVGLAGIAVVSTASVLVVVGLASGFGQLLGGRIWLGQLIVGLVILLAAGAGAWLALNRGLRNYQRSLVEKYELRKEEERVQFGTNVEDRAQERSPSA